MAADGEAAPPGLHGYGEAAALHDGGRRRRGAAARWDEGRGVGDDGLNSLGGGSDLGRGSAARRGELGLHRESGEGTAGRGGEGGGAAGRLGLRPSLVWELKKNSTEKKNPK